MEDLEAVPHLKSGIEEVNSDLGQIQTAICTVESQPCTEVWNRHISQERRVSPHGKLGDAKHTAVDVGKAGEFHCHAWSDVGHLIKVVPEL